MIKTNCRHIIWKYYVYSFLTGIHFVGAVLVPFFTDWGGVSYFTMQSIQAWFMLWIVLFELPTGALADKIGRKQTMIWGNFILALAVIVYTIKPNIWLFLLGEWLFAFSIALRSGSEQALVYEALESVNRQKEADHVFAKARSLSLIALAISAPIGSLIANFGLEMPMRLMLIPAIMAGILAFGFPDIRDMSEDPSIAVIIRSGVGYLLNHHQLRRLTIHAMLIAGAGYFVIWRFQPILMNMGVPLQYYGLVQTSLVISEVVIAALFSKILHYLGSLRNYLVMVSIIVSAGFIAVALAPNMVTLWIFVVFVGGFGLTEFDVLQATFNREIGKNRATVLSAISLVRRFLLVGLNPLVGLMTDASLSLSLLMIGLLPIVALFFLPKKD